MPAFASRFQFVCLLIILLSWLPPVSAESPVNIGDRRELFLERGLIDQITGDADLRLQKPVAREVVIKFDQPWEGSSSGYHTIIQEGDLYRLYYRGSHIIVSEGKLNTGSHKPYYCYAESKDGIHWTFVWGYVGNRLPVQENLAAGRLCKPGNQAQGSGFTTAAGSQ